MIFCSIFGNLLDNFNTDIINIVILRFIIISKILKKFINNLYIKVQI